jgi:hypothetical protein
MNILVERVVKNWKFSGSVAPEYNAMRINKMGDGRKFSSKNKCNYWSEAFNSFGIIPSCVEPMFMNMTCLQYKDQAFVHEHKDTAPNGFVHVRCNLMLKKPPTGGNPVIDGKELLVNEGDLWLCLSSLENHASTPIAGGERLVFSFGGLVDCGQIDKIICKN